MCSKIYTVPYSQPARVACSLTKSLKGAGVRYLHAHRRTAEMDASPTMSPVLAQKNPQHGRAESLGACPTCNSMRGGGSERTTHPSANWSARKWPDRMTCLFPPRRAFWGNLVRTPTGPLPCQLCNANRAVALQLGFASCLLRER